MNKWRTRSTRVEELNSRVFGVKLSPSGFAGETVRNYAGIGLLIGAGMGASLAAALHSNIAVFIAVGASVGLVFGLIMNRRN